MQLRSQILVFPSSVRVSVCVFQTDLSYRGSNHKPQDELQLDIQTNEGGLVALAAVDSALFTVRPNYRNPLSMVTRPAANKNKRQVPIKWYRVTIWH